MKRWNKKGQFFLIAAVITIMMIFTVTAQYNTVRQMVALEDFSELSGQYQDEKPKVINAALFTGSDETDAIEDFTEKFVDYAQQKEPGFGVLSVYRDQAGSVHVVNLLNNKVINIESSIGGEEVILELYCSGTGPACSSQGQICNDLGAAGQFCTTVETSAGNYGGDFSNIQTLEGAQFLVVTVPGLTANDPPVEIIYDLSAFISQDYVQAQDVEQGVVRVSLQQ